MARTATKKKIAFFSHASNLYGAPRSLLLLLEKLDLKKYDPLLVCPSNGPFVDEAKALGIPAYTIPADHPCREYGKKPLFEAISRRFSIFERIGHIFRLYLFLRKRKPHLVYVNTIAQASPIIAAKMLRIPCLVHVRESSEYLTFKGIIGRLHLCAILNFPDGFICVSKAVRDLLSSRSISFDKMTVVYNGVNLDQFRLSEETRRKYRNQIGLNDDHILVGLVAQITPRKAVDVLIETARLVHAEEKRCHFAVVGGFADLPFFEGKVLPLCRVHNLEDCVTFTGFKKDVRGYLAAIDIIVNASREEPFARVNLEAMAMEKPVVATNVGGNPEAVVDRETGYVVPVGDTEAMAKAILKLVRNEDLRNRFGKAGRERVERHFTSDHYCEGVQTVLNQMLI